MRTTLAAIAVIAATFAGAPAARAEIISLVNRTAKTPAELKVQVGLAALERKNFAEATAAFKESLRLNPKGVSPLLGLAQTAFAAGDRAAGEQYLRQAIENAPQSAELQTLWGSYLYFQKKQFSAAESALRQAAVMDRSGLAARVRLGDVYLVALQRPKDAADMYRQAIGIDPTFAGAHYGLGLALAASGDPRAGELELRESAKLQPGNPLPPHTLGRLYVAQRRDADALAAFDAAVAVKPDFAAAHMERGNVLFRLARPDEALSAFQRALAIQPRLVEAHIYSGMIHQQQGRYVAAERSYRAAIALEPKAAVAYNNLASMALDRHGDLPNAVRLAQQAISTQPGVPEFYGTLGWLYRALGDMAKAEAALQTGATLKPPSAEVTYRLAVVHQEQRKTAQAIREFKKALGMDPKFPSASDAAARLASLERDASRR